MKSISILLLFFSLFSACRQEGLPDTQNELFRASEALKSNHFVKTLAILRKIKDPQLKMKPYYLMQGLSYFKVGDYKRSAAAFEKAEPRAMDLKIYMAYLSLLNGDIIHASQLADELMLQFSKRPEVSVLKGNISLKQQQYEASETHFKRSISLQKNFLKGYIGLANTYLSQRAFVKAEEYFIKAVFLSEDEPSAYIALSNFYFLMNRYQDAENNLKNALRRFPGDVNCLMLLGAVHIKTNHFFDATNIFKQVLDLHPKSLHIRVSVIKSFLELNQFEETSEMIQGLFQSEEERFYGFSLLGESFLRKNDLDRALSEFNNALVLRPNSYEVNYYLGLIHLLRNKFRLSKRFLESAVTTFPGFSNAQLLLGLIHLSTHKYRLASEYARLVLLLNPKNISAHTLNALALSFQGEEQAAAYEFEVAQKLSEKNMLVPFFDAMMSIEKKAYKNAKNAISDIDVKFSERLFLELELLKRGGLKGKDPGHFLRTYLKGGANFFTSLAIGNYYKSLGDSSSANDYLKKSLSENEENAVPYYLLAETEMDKGNIEEAIVFLNRSIEVDPLFLKSYQSLGILYEKVENFDLARFIYRKGLEYYPEDGLLLNNLAWILLSHFDDRTSAYPHIRNAVNQSPGDMQAKDTLAWWYYSNEEFKRAISLLEKIVNLHPDRALYHFHLGMSYHKVKKRDLAEKSLKMALKLKIEKKHVLQIKKVLSGDPSGRS